MKRRNKMRNVRIDKTRVSGCSVLWLADGSRTVDKILGTGRKAGTKWE